MTSKLLLVRCQHGAVECDLLELNIILVDLGGLIGVGIAVVVSLACVGVGYETNGLESGAISAMLDLELVVEAGAKLSDRL